ncbi:L-fucose isomerase [Akkermansia sp. N21169]|jgi:L-fucose isomerase|uniref:L-fucose isomerase n=1 Tax=Akkermansia sp. N21169 TaxID=3040765 RepID=UPI00244ED889|nr:L-fucose isomerase [Akkermansia sp. N21169]MDH3068738.1 L-fucose isomerase [Akkermansia sp. N21169]
MKTNPTIGIRPVIDGRRRGVRESLEEQTMNMARSAAKLIESTLRHADGSPVKCVIADTTIGGTAEACMCADKFKANNVGMTLTVTPCWCYGSETMDMDPLLPKAIWGFNGTERPGAVYLAAALAGHTQKGLPAFSIYGHDVQDAQDDTIPADVEEKILRFVRAGLVVADIRGKSYMSLGGCSMGIAGSIVDQSLFENYLGMRVQAVDMTELRRRMELGIYDVQELQLAMSWVNDNFIMGEDRNSEKSRKTPEENKKILKECVMMTMIVRDMMQGNKAVRDKGFIEEGMGYNAILGGFQGQRHWTDFYPNGDTMEALLNSTFDWNGPRAPMPVATENDSLNGICLLLGYQLTGKASIFADVRTYWSPDAVKRVTGHTLEGTASNGFIHLINSGAAALDGSCAMTDAEGKPTMKPHWEVTCEDTKLCMQATKWCPAISEYFRGGGYSSCFLTKGGVPFTMLRVNMVKGLGPVLQLAEGWSVDLPADVHNTLNLRTDPSWPTTWFAPRLTGKGAFTDVYSVMANWGANHGVLVHGHIGADVITLASMLRIPVCMHNIEDSQIFRPSAWASFGMDKEGSDYRACAAYGPIYGKY